MAVTGMRWQLVGYQYRIYPIFTLLLFFSFLFLSIYTFSRVPVSFLRKHATDTILDSLLPGPLRKASVTIRLWKRLRARICLCALHARIYIFVNNYDKIVPISTWITLWLQTTIFICLEMAFIWKVSFMWTITERLTSVIRISRSAIRFRKMSDVIEIHQLPLTSFTMLLAAIFS